MAHRFIEPFLQPLASGPANRQDHPLGAGVTRLGPQRLGVPDVDQSVQRPVDEGSSCGEHTAHLSCRLQLLGDGETMFRLLGQDTEHRVFGGGETI